MANKQGTRWRGQIPIPSHAHPLVRRLIEIANEQMTTLSEVGERAGQSPKTISNWRYRSVPRLDNFEACLNAMGYELIVREMKNRDKSPELARDVGIGPTSSVLETEALPLS